MAKSKRPILTATAAVIALLGVTAADLVFEAVPEFEGYSEEGYFDILGIPTKCFGDTTDVVVGKFYDIAECTESFERQIIAHAEPVLKCTPGLADYPHALAAAVSFTYNLGGPTYCKSTAAKRFNEGKLREGCNALGLYNKGRVNGKLVVIEGLKRRRNKEVAMCLVSAEQQEEKEDGRI